MPPGRVPGRAAPPAARLTAPEPEPPGRLPAPEQEPPRRLPAADDDGLGDLVAALSVEAKALLLTGADSWRTQGADAIGLRPMVASDGPAGARGTSLDERHPSSSLPCPAALGATWDPVLVREVAAALGAEARAKGIDILLAPTINMVRTPLGGRSFECFAEDPVLTSQIAAEYVRGLQSAGVAATLKHYVGNDSETGRWTYDVQVAEHVLREIYLAPFEACVREGGALGVMAAYNRVNGVPMTEHARLLRDVLKGEWGFDGVVMSDWHAARSTAATALAALDLSMPGPDGPWGSQLARAVASGEVSRSVLDDKVLRLLRLARRVGALAPPAGRENPAGQAGGAATAPVPDGARPARAERGLLRRAAAASFVLLRNSGGILPLAAGMAGARDAAHPARRQTRKIAVVGPNALRPAIQGGGSAAVVPAAVSTPAEALTNRLAGRAEVIVAEGAATWAAVPEPPPGSLRDPATGEPGLRLEFRAGDGTLLDSEHRSAAMFAWWDGTPPGVGWGESGSITLLADYLPAGTATHLLGASGVGRLSLSVDGRVIADEATGVPDDPVQAMTRPGEVRARARLRAGVAARLELQFRPAAGGAGPLGLRLGVAQERSDDELLAEAERAASGADAAVVVVGSAELTESEGFDRQTLALPGRQDELVRRVSAVNKATIVVVNSGAPVLMPWAGEVAAIVYAWLPGQEFGEALADVLLGFREPGGRLPVTMPACEGDCPVLHATPEAGALRYREGLLIGYRGYDAAGTEPLFPFGHGLGYTTWAYEALDVPARTLAAGDDLDLTVTVRNTGARAGQEVIQAYIDPPRDDLSLSRSPASPGSVRPLRTLAAFATAQAGPGARASVSLRIPARGFARWDEQAGGWAWPRGRFTVRVGRSSRDLRLSAPVDLG